MDLWYNLLKIVSMIATGLFGALGLLTKYKDEPDKITKWGKIALGGILISSGFSLGLYILETSRAKAAAEIAKAEVVATGQVLEHILGEAQTTADQQKASLGETKALKSGLQETLRQQRLNLQRSDYIAKGMEHSLVAQRSILAGNEKILGGVRDTMDKQGEVLGLSASTLEDTKRLLNPISSLQLRVHLTIPLETP